MPIERNIVSIMEAHEMWLPCVPDKDRLAQWNRAKGSPTLPATNVTLASFSYPDYYRLIPARNLPSGSL